MAHSLRNALFLLRQWRIIINTNKMMPWLKEQFQQYLKRVETETSDR